MKKWRRERGWLIRDKYAGDQTVDLTADLKRLKAGEPIDYIIGWKEFLGVKVDLSLKPLIPREETEFWVGQVLLDTNVLRMMTNDTNKKIEVLDIFAGSGCVGLAILKHCPGAKVGFADIEKRAVGVKVIKSNVFDRIRGKYDLILANPPYIPAGRRLNPSVAKFEPRRALRAGPDGLSVIKKFLQDLPRHLKKGGVCYLEFGSSQKTKINKLLKKLDYQNYSFHRDQFGRWRYLVLGL